MQQPYLSVNCCTASFILSFNVIFSLEEFVKIALSAVTVVVVVDSIVDSLGEVSFGSIGFLFLS